jgi:hypothetical protein
MEALAFRLRERLRMARRVKVLAPKQCRGAVLYQALVPATSPKLQAQQQAVQAMASPRLQPARAKLLEPMLDQVQGLATEAQAAEKLQAQPLPQMGAALGRRRDAVKILFLSLPSKVAA